MKKIILITFLSFFISSVSSSNSGNIKIAPSSKENEKLINKCKESELKEELVFVRNYSTRYDPVVYENYGKDDLKGSRIISNLFLDSQKKEFIFYDNLGGVLIKKYVFSGSMTKPDLKSISFVIADKKGESLYTDYKRQRLDNKGLISENNYHIKLKEYSISIKDYFDETIKKKHKREISNQNFICRETVLLGIKN